MIYDSLTNAALYRGLGPRFTLAFDFLAEFDPATPPGRISLDDDNVYALVQSYQTITAASRPFEAHRAYADIQFVAEGEEIIGDRDERVGTDYTTLVRRITASALEQGLDARAELQVRSEPRGHTTPAGAAGWIRRQLETGHAEGY